MHTDKLQFDAQSGPAGRQDVVVVDGLEETAEVLKAVLEPRGMSIRRIRRCESAGRLPDGRTPSVVILHEDDAADGENGPVRGNVSVNGPWRNIPQVIIGSARIDAPCSACQVEPESSREYLSKPFRYRELIDAIDRLLDSKANVRRAA